MQLYDTNALFSHLSDFAVVGLVLGGQRPTRPWFHTEFLMGENLWSLIEQCWKQIPSERLTAPELLKRINEINFSPSVDTFPDVLVDLGPEPPTYFENRRNGGLLAQVEEVSADEMSAGGEVVVTGPGSELENAIDASPNTDVARGWSLSSFAASFNVRDTLFSMLMILLAAALPFLIM